MFCSHCGKEINDKAIVCVNCGVAIDNVPSNTVAPKEKNIMAILGFVFSFFFNIIGLVLSIIGYMNAKKPEYAGDGKGLALAGIIISAISIAFTIIYVLVYIWWIWIMIIGAAC